MYCGSNSHDLQLKAQFDLLDAFKQSFGFDVAVKSVLQRKPVNCQLNSEYALSAGTKAPLSNSFIIFRHILRLAAQKRARQYLNINCNQDANSTIFRAKSKLVQLQLENQKKWCTQFLEKNDTSPLIV